MTDTSELRHVLSFIQSHLDKHDVDLVDVVYDVDNHATESWDNDGIRDIEVTGSTVRFSVEYTFDYDE